jgi:hypothetical protein
MASNSVPKNRSKSAAPPESDSTSCYERLVSELAHLSCVHSVLSEVAEESGDIGSAEIVLSQSIERLYAIAFDILKAQDQIAAGAADSASVRQ